MNGLRFGIVSQVDASKGLVRVNFDEDDIVSYWLSVVTPGTKDDSFCSVPDIGEQVACMMDENAENGVCIGAVFSEDRVPALLQRGVQFKDGTVIKYDRNDHKLTVQINDTSLIMYDGEISAKVGDTEHKFTPIGHTVTTGAESLKQILSDMLDYINAHTHAETGTTTLVPVNIASFTALRSRVESLFEG